MERVALCESCLYPWWEDCPATSADVEFVGGSSKDSDMVIQCDMYDHAQTIKNITKKGKGG